MSAETERGRERIATAHLEYVAAALAFLVAGLHLFHSQHGFGRLVSLLTTDPDLLVTHPRPVAFVLSGLAIVVGVNLAVLGAPKRPLYALGMALMATYVLGYLAWHLSGHGGFLPGRAPHFHDRTPVEQVVQHLANDAWAALAIVAETVLLAVLAVLYVRET